MSVLVPFPSAMVCLRDSPGPVTSASFVASAHQARMPGPGPPRTPMDGSVPHRGEVRCSSLATDEQIERVADRITATPSFRHYDPSWSSSPHGATPPTGWSRRPARPAPVPCPTRPTTPTPAGRPTSSWPRARCASRRAPRVGAAHPRCRGRVPHRRAGRRPGPTGAHGGGIVTAVDTERIEAALAEGRVARSWPASRPTPRPATRITLGRGGADTSAVAPAQAALGAGTCEIYTYVDGGVRRGPAGGGRGRDARGAGACR